MVKPKTAKKDARGSDKDKMVASNFRLFATGGRERHVDESRPSLPSSLKTAGKKKKVEKAGSGSVGGGQTEQSGKAKNDADKLQVTACVIPPGLSGSSSTVFLDDSDIYADDKSEVGAVSGKEATDDESSGTLMDLADGGGEEGAGAGVGGEQMTTKRVKPGERVVEEILRLQESTNLLLPKAAFRRVVQEVGEQYHANIHFSDEAVLMLQTVFEDDISNFFHKTTKVVGVAKKSTLTLDIWRATISVRDYPLWTKP